MRRYLTRPSQNTASAPSLPSDAEPTSRVVRRVGMRLVVPIVLLLAACALSPDIERRCTSEPAQPVRISCDEAIDLAMEFAEEEHEDFQANSALVEFARSYLAAEGQGVPAWVVTLDSPWGTL